MTIKTKSIKFNGKITEYELIELPSFGTVIRLTVDYGVENLSRLVGVLEERSDIVASAT